MNPKIVLISPIFVGETKDHPANNTNKDNHKTKGVFAYRPHLNEGTPPD